MRNIPTLLLIVGSLLCAFAAPVDVVYEKLIGIGLSLFWFVVALRDLKEGAENEPGFFMSFVLDSVVLKISFTLATLGLFTMGARISGVEVIALSKIEEAGLLYVVSGLYAAAAGLAVHAWLLPKAEAKAALNAAAAALPISAKVNDVAVLELGGKSRAYAMTEKGTWKEIPFIPKAAPVVDPTDPAPSQT